MGKLRQFITQSIVHAVAELGDRLDEFGSGRHRDDLMRIAMENRDRASVLALENETLRDRVDELQFNGPTLYRDEVEAMEFLVRYVRDNSSGGHMAHSYADVVEGVLRRCDPMPFTEKEISDVAQAAIQGTKDGTNTTLKTPEDVHDFFKRIEERITDGD